jgi:outer membrane protein OmpA-like peptidoglycan-associated protein
MKIRIIEETQHMKRLFTYFGITFFICINFFELYAQENLVRDPGFEENKKLPSSTGQGESCLIYWANPNAGNFDYFNKEAISKKAGVPDNYFGNQQPHSRNAYAGICIINYYREFAYSKLKQVLKKNQEYCISLYISRAENSESYINSFGIMFAAAPWNINYIPQIIFTDKKGYTDDKNWICLHAKYKAEGEERFIVTGYFDSKRTPNSHYYIDDISVIRISNDEDCECIPSEEIQMDEAKKTDEKNENVIITDTAQIHNIEYDSLQLDQSIIIENICFDVDRAELKETSFAELDKIIEFLNSNPTVFIEISGHTDNSGENARNKKLSEMRAKSVAEYLITNGIEDERIEFKGYASGKPIDDNSTEEGRAKNRRVEFKILKK